MKGHIRTIKRFGRREISPRGRRLEVLHAGSKVVDVDVVIARSHSAMQALAHPNTSFQPLTSS